MREGGERKRDAVEGEADERERLRDSDDAVEGKGRVVAMAVVMCG